MEIHVRDDKHFVEVWLSNAEKKDTSLRDSLKRLYDEYKKKKYLVAVFESGEGISISRLWNCFHTTKSDAQR